MKALCRITTMLLLVLIVDNTKAQVHFQETQNKAVFGWVESGEWDDGAVWIKWPDNPIFIDDATVVYWGREYYPGTVLFFENYYHMWFSCFHTNASAQPKIGYATSNYILVDPPIENITLETGGTHSINLDDHFQYIQGLPDSVVIEDTISFSLLSNSDPEIADVSLTDGNVDIVAGSEEGSTRFEIMASVGFTKNYRNVKVEVQNPLLIRTQANDIEMKIFPNPAVNELNIEINKEISRNVAIDLFDLTGKMIIAEVHTLGKHSTSIDVTELEKGIYLLKICMNNNVLVEKIVKK